MPEHINQNKFPINGKVAARTCDCCGHHEIGIALEDGTFIPLKPGMTVKILDRGPENE